jgi:spore germination cell wall hydrolase CwlJ-like protein
MAKKCKGLNRRWILLALLVLLIFFALVCCATEAGKKAVDADYTKTSNEAPELVSELTQPISYVFIYGEGYPVNMQTLTDTWAAEAGIEKRYSITDEERYELASAITAEAIGEPLAGKIAVAQCILQACEDDGIRPIETLTKYKYSTRRPEPTNEAMEAVTVVFDFGHVATSEPIKYFYAPDLVAGLWHESQVYVMTINNHRFFKEVQPSKIE